jgi:HAMP domain-containing protein
MTSKESDSERGGASASAGGVRAPTATVSSIATVQQARGSEEVVAALDNERLREITLGPWHRKASQDEINALVSEVNRHRLTMQRLIDLANIYEQHGKHYPPVPQQKVADDIRIAIGAKMEG